MSRKQIRHRPNFRKTARARPHREHRVYARTPNFGFRCDLTTSAFLAICASYPSGFLERETEPLEQATGLLVVGRGGDDGDVHPTLPVDLVRVHLMEHELLGQAEGVVAVAVELPRGQPTKVPDPGQGQGKQPVEELPHPVAAQCDPGAERLSFTQLELRDGSPRTVDLRLLAGDRRQVGDSTLDQLRVTSSLTNTHVDRDLGESGHLHDVGDPELVLESGNELVTVLLLEPRHRRGRDVVGNRHQMSLPVRRETRTLAPSCAERCAIRVGFPPSANATLLPWIGASFVTTSLCWPPAGLAFLCFLTRFTPSTMTRSSLGMALTTLPVAPLSLPARTITSS